MPSENLEEQGLERNPNLTLAQKKFLLTLPSYKNDATIKEELLKGIKEDNMAPFYEECCRDLKWTVNQPFLDQMQKENETQLKTLTDVIEDAETSQGESEIREANLKKAEYLSRIDRESFKAFTKTYDKTVSLGQRLDLVFHNIRIGIFYLDHSLITRNLEKAKSLIEEGGDWDRRNRLKVYEGVYCWPSEFQKELPSFSTPSVHSPPMNYGIQ
ncbi:26S proteasome non-ATPase regulatory subunit 6 [Armadillidium vulgare]|nr:26S proteasome non-ATPase regulatory subunit 6 [Armadillidium vulgare]